MSGTLFCSMNQNCDLPEHLRHIKPHLFNLNENTYRLGDQTLQKVYNLIMTHGLTF